jgi:replicative DNA helicase
MDAERKLLAALCQSALAADTRAIILRRLRDHSFAEPDHEVVYRALVAMPAAGAPEALQGLTQAVTRMGFPDLDLSDLFKKYSPPPDELVLLLARL